VQLGSALGALESGEEDDERTVVAKELSKRLSEQMRAPQRMTLSLQRGRGLRAKLRGGPRRSVGGGKWHVS